MDELKPGLDGTVENLQTSTDNLASMTARVDRLVHEHEDDIGRFMEVGLAESPAIMQDARSTLREIEKLVQKLQQDPSQLIQRRDQSQVEIDPLHEKSTAISNRPGLRPGLYCLWRRIDQRSARAAGLPAQTDVPCTGAAI